MNYQAVLKICCTLVLLATARAQAGVQVFACEPEWAALAGEIGGANVETISATNALQDPHYIQARPSLIAGIRKADLLICSGSGLEDGWLPVLLRKGNNPKIQPGQPGHLAASQYVKRLDVPAVLDRAQGDLHAQGNPHIQTDPRNIALVARVVAQRLQQIDPGNAEAYRGNLAAFEEKWSAAINRWQQQAAPLRGKRVVLHHRSWVYLDNWLGLEEEATLEAKPGVPPSAAHLNELLTQLKASPAALIIRAPYQDPQPSEWLTKQTGIPNAALPFTVGGTPDATDLYSLFDVTIRILLEKMGPAGE
ncbi:MAG: zinc ABC transporter substrate-binding protein [Gammaproteobacteria bacterium]|nr:zinc ABC transporter substrate-binding protein [Gammaproteobacteria bacterium]